VAAEARAQPSLLAATPSPRSDWPAAMSGEAAPTPLRLPREEGTDGLMGRLVFGLPNDTPTIHVEPTNRWTIDDDVTGWSDAGLDTTPPWVRRIGGLSSFVTDPYMR
jgi:hypothetical protein